MCRDKITHHLIGRGSDPRHLGRWTWMRFRGRHDLTLRVIVVYRPTKSSGATTVYQQQRSALLLTNIDTCPCSKFFSDLSDEIHSWKTTGDQLINAGDFNEYTGGVKLQQFFGDKDMREIFFHRHGHPPNTHAEGWYRLTVCSALPLSTQYIAVSLPSIGVPVVIIV
jgi:hypothetical protein